LNKKDEFKINENFKAIIEIIEKFISSIKLIIFLKNIN